MNAGGTPLIVGCGDIGLRLATLYNKQVNAVVRTKESKCALQEKGITAVCSDFDNENEKVDWPDGTKQLFWFVPPPKHGESDTRLHNAFATLPSRVKKIVLISTTGVYGDCDAEWVTESQTPNPRADRAKRRLSAELQLQDWAESKAVDWVILRVPGIYAIDRLPIARIHQGTPMVQAEESGWTNRIHADDLARVCQLAMQSDFANQQIFNATDGHPSTMTDYFDAIADFIGLPRPPKITLAEAEQQLSGGMLSYLKESRKISNAKLLETFDLKLQYPSLGSFIKQTHYAT